MKRGRWENLVSLLKSLRRCESNEDTWSKSLILVFLLALGVRLTPVIWGLKGSLRENSAFNTDEPLVLSVVTKMVNRGSLEPDNFIYPSFFAYNVLFFGSVASAIVGDSYGTYLLAGRLTSLLYDILSLFVTYRIGSVFFGKRVGVTSALLLALAKLHVIRSAMALPDTLMVFLLLLTLLFSIRISKNRQPYKNYVLAGICAGLAFSTKYLAVFAPTMIVVAHLLALRKIGVKGKLTILKSIIDRRILLSMTSFIAGFLVGSPFVLVSPDKFVRDLSIAIFAAARAPGAWGYESTSPLIFVEGMVWGMGITLFLIAFLGVLYHVVARGCLNLRAEDIPIIWLVIYAVPIVSIFSVRAPQYLLILYPITTIYAAKFISNLRDKATLTKRNKAHYLIILSMITVLSTSYVLAYNVRILHDTRDEASAWVANNVPSDASIVITQYVLIPSEFNNVKVLDWSSESSIFNMDIQAYDYVVISSDFYERYLTARSMFPREANFYASLLEGSTRYVMVARFSTISSSIWGDPTVDIYTFGLSAFVEYIQQPSSPHYGPVVTVFKLQQ